MIRRGVRSVYYTYAYLYIGTYIYIAYICDIIIQYIILSACKRREKSNERTVCEWKNTREYIMYICRYLGGYTCNDCAVTLEPGVMTRAGQGEKK